MLVTNWFGRTAQRTVPTLAQLSKKKRTLKRIYEKRDDEGRKANFERKQVPTEVKYQERKYRNELFRNRKKEKFGRLRVITQGIDDIWAADLADMNNFNKNWVHGRRDSYPFLLMVIDTFSKFG